MICWRSRSRLYRHTEQIRIQKVESVGHRVVNIWSSEKLDTFFKTCLLVDFQIFIMVIIECTNDQALILGFNVTYIQSLVNNLENLNLNESSVHAKCLVIHI